MTTDLLARPFEMQFALSGGGAQSLVRIELNRWRGMGLCELAWERSCLKDCGLSKPNR